MQYPSMTLADIVIRDYPDDYLKRVVREATRFYIGNVADYWHEHAPSSDGELQNMVPNVAPIGDKTWFEWRTGTITYGIMCYTMVDVPKEPHLVAHLIETMKECKLDGAPAAFEAPPDCRWVISMLSVLYHHDRPNNPVEYPDAWAALYLRGDGSICGGFTMGNAPYFQPEYPDYSDKTLAIRRYGPALLATCFAHCKNVPQGEMRPSRQIQRAADRAGTAAPVYKVLDIDPTRVIQRDEGNIAHQGRRRARHKVRAHFATWTAEKPLFGRVVGTFWIHEQYRGSEEVGEVIKDYRVLRP